MQLSVTRHEPGILCDWLLTGRVTMENVNGTEHECGSVPECKGL